jgi:hypothetical protein
MKRHKVPGRLLLVGAGLAWAVVAAGCYYHDFDLETVDHYTHYGKKHSVDATFYHGDGADD